MPCPLVSECFSGQLAILHDSWGGSGVSCTPYILLPPAAAIYMTVFKDLLMM